MSLLETVPGQAVLRTVARLRMGECCLSRAENTSGCVLKIKLSAQMQGSF